MHFISRIILLLGLPAGVLVGIDIGGLLDVPQWLLSQRPDMTAGLVLLTGVLVGIFGKVD